MTGETSLRARIVALLRNVQKTQPPLRAGLMSPRGKTSKIAWKIPGSRQS